MDAVLIPEVKFTLDGEKGLFAYLERIMQEKGHCVLCVAEGAGQVRSNRKGGRGAGAAWRTSGDAGVDARVMLDGGEQGEEKARSINQSTLCSSQGGAPDCSSSANLCCRT